MYCMWVEGVSSYTKMLNTKSDIREHLGLLHGLAMQCKDVVELGFRTGVSTTALLASGARVTSYDRDPACRPHVRKLAKEYPKTFAFYIGNSRVTPIPECDMLFIDTDHTYETTHTELWKHHRDVKKFIVLHDTVSFGRKDRPPGKGPGIMTAVDEFLLEYTFVWRLLLHLPNCNGLTVLEKLI